MRRSLLQGQRHDRSHEHGKLGFVDNGRGADTISFSGFALNEVEYGWIKYTVRDSTGATATARFPATGSLSITRTS